MGENLWCPGNRVLTKEGEDNYDRIFYGKKKVVEKLEMRYCTLCGDKCGEMSDKDWLESYETICDECDEYMARRAGNDRLWGN